MRRNIIFPDELIGEEIEVVETTNDSLAKLHGKVVDESKNTLTVEVGGTTKIILKNTITFKIVSSGKLVDGKTIVRRPEDRVKGK
jgi:ribonuclease P protein subunit POP4